MEFWAALWLALSIPLPPWVANFLDALGEWDEWLLEGARDFLRNNWRWLVCGITLIWGCCFLIVPRWWWRYWSLFPFRCAYYFLFFLHYYSVALREEEHVKEASKQAQKGNETPSKGSKGSIARRRNKYGMNKSNTENGRCTQQ